MQPNNPIDDTQTPRAIDGEINIKKELPTYYVTLDDVDLNDIWITFTFDNTFPIIIK